MFSKLSIGLEVFSNLLTFVIVGIAIEGIQELTLEELQSHPEKYPEYQNCYTYICTRDCGSSDKLRMVCDGSLTYSVFGYEYTGTNTPIFPNQDGYFAAVIGLIIVLMFCRFWMRFAVTEIQNQGFSSVLELIHVVMVLVLNYFIIGSIIRTLIYTYLNGVVIVSIDENSPKTGDITHSEDEKGIFVVEIITSLIFLISVFIVFGCVVLKYIQNTICPYCQNRLLWANITENLFLSFFLISCLTASISGISLIVIFLIQIFNNIKLFVINFGFSAVIDILMFLEGSLTILRFSIALYEALSDIGRGYDLI